MKVIIMQGITGAGKTTLAQTFGEGLRTVIVSADDFFRQGAKFRFIGAILGRAHTSCRRKFAQALLTKPNLIVVDNSNLEPSHFDFYVTEAQKAKYQVIFCRVICKPEVAAARSKHKGLISLPNLTKFADKLEKSVPPLPFVEFYTDG